MTGATAECAWGEGPDVLVTVGSRAGWVPYDGGAGSFCLTLAEAKRLKASLETAIARVEELEAMAAAHDGSSP